MSEYNTVMSCQEIGVDYGEIVLQHSLILFRMKLE